MKRSLRTADSHGNASLGTANEEGLSPEDQETASQVKVGLDGLETLVPIVAPNSQWMETLVTDHQKTIRKRLFRDLALFLGAAIIILCCTLAALAQLPALFIALQAAVLLIAPLVLLVRERKRVRS